MAAPSLTANLKKTDDKDRVDMRLYNVIVIYDVYVAARSNEAARDALVAAIAAGDLKANEVTSMEVRSRSAIRASWLDQAPFIGADITDEEFEKLKGITVEQAFERFYAKSK